MKHSFLLLLLSLFTISISYSQIKSTTDSEFPVLKGPYLGQKPPGMIPELFAPGIISNGLSNRDVTISPDGKEMYFGLHSQSFQFSTIVLSKQINGVWSKPEVASFATDPRFVYLEPFLNFEGTKLFFLSNMPKDGTDKPGDEDIWVVDKIHDSWGEPYNLGEPINSDGSEFFPSLTEDGTMYFTRAAKGQRIHFIYRSRFVNGTYSTPEKLPEQVNCGTNRFNAYVAPDESFMVVPAVGMKDGMGGVDYYIVFRNEDDTWQEPVNMGPKFNSATGSEWSFYLSPDKQYAFFMATKELPKELQPKKLSFEFFQNLTSMPQNGTPDIYWIDAAVLKTLKPE